MQPFGLLELLQSFLPLNNTTGSTDTPVEKEEKETDANSVSVINEPAPT